MKQLIRAIPIPISGVMLALFSLAKLVKTFELTWFANGLIFMGAVFLSGLLLKIVLAPERVLKEMKNPLIAAVSPTFTMALMVLSSLYMDTIVVWENIWWFALVLHFVLMLYFTYRFVLRTALTLSHIYPSWFIMYIGMGIMPLTAGGRAPALMDIVFYSCITFVIILVPLMLVRIFVMRNLEVPTLPLITILCAPVSLTLAGYLAHFEAASTKMVLTLVIIAQLLYVLVLTQLPQLLRLPFFPSYAAFTFPLVICATALTNAVHYLGYTGPIVTTVIVVEITFATVIVLYVTARYVVFLWREMASARKVALNE